jgi:hypothetical protein
MKMSNLALREIIVASSTLIMMCYRQCGGNWRWAYYVGIEPEKAK